MVGGSTSGKDCDFLTGIPKIRVPFCGPNTKHKNSILEFILGSHWSLGPPILGHYQVGLCTKRKDALSDCGVR